MGNDGESVDLYVSAYTIMAAICILGGIMILGKSQVMLKFYAAGILAIWTWLTIMNYWTLRAVWKGLGHYIRQAQLPQAESHYKPDAQDALRGDRNFWIFLILGIWFAE